MATSGLENILRLSEQEAKQNPELGAVNTYSVMIEERYGLDKIEFLQSHENQNCIVKMFTLIFILTNH